MELKTYFAQDRDGSVLPDAYVYLYEPGTTNLVSGIEDINGASLNNPFQASADGLVQLSAPDGNYDLRIASGGLDTTMRVQFLDAPAAIGTIQASTAQAAADATRAETARDVAQLSAGVYVDTVAGLAATSEGEYFSVPSADDAEYLVLYKHDAGPVGAEVKRYPSATAFTDLVKGVASRNLFNKDAADVALGYFPSHTNGALQANASYNTTGFIPVVAGESYTVSSKHYVVWYTAAKAFISGSASGDTNLTQVAPATAAYVRCSAALSKWEFYQVENGTTASAHEPFGQILPPERLRAESIPGDKLTRKTVSVLTTDFIAPGKNLFNPQAILAGYFIGNDGTAPVANATYHASDFIAVTAGATYRAEANGVGPRFVTYYSTSKTFVTGGVNNGAFTTLTFVPPVGVAYVRVSILASTLSAFQMEENTVATPYEPYGYRVAGPNGETLLPLPGEVLEKRAVSYEKTNFLALGKNLFNMATMTAGFIAANGNIAASSTYSYSDYIAVTPGVTYYGKGAISMRMLAFYDAGKEVVAGGSDTNLTTFTPPAGAVYARISITTTDAALFQLEVGASATAYEKFGYKVQGPNGEGLIIPTSGNNWLGKSWATLGDSITAQALWQSAVVSKLGFLWTNFGIGGTKLSGAPGDANAMCQDTRINAIPTSTDLITVMGGTNDWAQNVPLGAITSSDPLEFYGALNSLFSKLMTRFPARRVVIFTTPYGEIYNYEPRGWPDAKTNTQGLTTWDYAEAVRTAAQRWGVPCIDIAGQAGWNAVNITTYIGDDGALLHPNAVGGARISEVVIGGLKRLEPQS